MSACAISTSKKGARSHTPANRENGSPPIKVLRECFDYNLAKGTLTWRIRPLDHFRREADWKGFNTRWSKSPALATLGDGGYAGGKFAIAGQVYQVKRGRAIWALAHGEWPHKDVGRKNGVLADDALDNLFLQSPSVKATIQHIRHRQAGKPRGARLPPGVKIDHTCVPYITGRYQVSVSANGRVVYVGRFFTLRKAAAVYVRLKARVDRARLGKIGWSGGSWSVAEWTNAIKPEPLEGDL